MCRALDTFARHASAVHDGAAAIVEMTTVDYGRDARTLAELAKRSGVAIVAATGFNQGAFANRITERYNEDELARWMIVEVRDGALGYADPDAADLHSAGTSIRAGLIKGASGKGGPDPHERKVLRAAVAAHLATGAPIGTHTEKGTWVAEQAEFLVDAGAQPDKVLIGHCDFLPGLAELLEVARTGVRIGLDQFSKEKYLPDRVRVERIAGLASEGFLDRVIVAGDLARRSYHPELASAARNEAGGGSGAPGLAHVPRDVVPMLRAAGLSDADVARIVHGNPIDWLAFAPLAY
jgi:phosphotriesterase-related protein